MLKAITLMGETASGKSALSLALAPVLPIEIINVDSALIYKEMNIGTAKPTAEELQQVPHHLIDIKLPNEVFSVSEFLEASTKIAQEIITKGRIPVFVGGSMLYFNALKHGMANLPQSDESVRLKLSSEMETLGLSAMHERLQSCDPHLAKRVMPNDWQRIQRGLEVFELTKTPLSVLQKELQKSDFDLLEFAIRVDKETINQRIEKRFEMMLEQGFVEEVKALKATNELNLNMPSMRAVGYRQIWEYLDDLYTYEEMKERGIIATRQLAKRQRTWLRKWENVIDLNGTPSQNLVCLCDKLTDFWKK